MEKIVIYTAVFGPIGDKLYPPQGQPKDVLCVAYVDSGNRPKGASGTVHNGWELREPVFEHEDPRRRARAHKLLPHKLFPDADYSLWVDGCLTPKHSVRDLVDLYLADYDICLFEHMQRGCVYKELEACLRLRKDVPQVMRKQVDAYRDAGYPYDNGLAETTAVLRRHNVKIAELNQRWYDELTRGSVRDQLSFDFVAWQSKVPYATFAGNRTKSPHFKWRAHR